MDTKWKNRKNAISFIIFALGVSMAFGGMADILKNKPSRVGIWQVDELFEEDYQQNYRFQEYITGCFWNFLAMAVGGDLQTSWGYGMDGDYYCTYYGDEMIGGWNDEWEAYQDNLDDMQDIYEDMEEEWERLLQEGAYEEASAYREEIDAYQKEMEDFQREVYIVQEYGYKEPTDEEKKKTAQKYHDRIKGDKNLLYTISYDGETLYANSEQLLADGKMTAPKGYNFLLYFDGEKVRIVKDGIEQDIYGDGYYREESSWSDEERARWYVPGYVNFPADESIKKVRISIAAAEEPVLYMEGSYDAVGYIRYDNSLYWMYDNCRVREKLLEKAAMYVVLGIAMLLVALWGRKSRRETEAKIAGIQGRIWIECKVILFLGLLVAVLFFMKSSNYGYWEELSIAFCYDYEYYDYGFAYGLADLPMYGREILRNTPSITWVVLFWGIWLIVNDLKHNKKVWRKSLIGKLYKTFSIKSLSWPFARRMAYRSLSVFVIAVFYALLVMGTAFWRNGSYGNEMALGFLAVIATVIFFFLAYLMGKKNMETARDMEAISDRISEIRNGNYTGIEGDFAGHDLQNVMTELEDIRHGMEKAVEEQMKSQKMKVELIANVSHDIKTPLTSIISYVQFLKQEEGLSEHVKDYVRILDEKSQRLKNMVQDVFAVSKAASGELPMHMEELDFGKLLSQTLADMEEQIKSSTVSFRTDIPKEPVMIMADGQRMYRVFQNLFQNAIQYSLAGSRVYVALQADGNGAMAVASVKNASFMEFDKEKDFAERFTRGDKSRTDGGSGLGLSIAQSFTEACGGEFSWKTDADLFVVQVSFQIVKK